jgi:hypothetical protein
VVRFKEGGLRMSSTPAEDQHEQPVHRFDWNDASIYQWTFLVKKRDTVGLLSYWLGGAIFYPLLVCGALWLLGLLSLGLAYWAGVVGTGFILLVFAFHIYLSFKGKPHERREARSIVYWTAIATLGGLLYILSAPQSHFAQGFHGTEGAGVWLWALFFIDNAASLCYRTFLKSFSTCIYRTSVMIITPPG